MKEVLLDADIREPLFFFLEEKYGKTRIFEEKMIGSSRADSVMVTEQGLFGIEIKSDADTYTRLKTQVRDYDKYYDYNYVVVGSTHGLHIKEHVPEYWGIITVEQLDDKVDFYVMREPLKNPKCMLDKKLSILWRIELVKLQELHDMPKYAEKSKDFVRQKIIERTQYPEDKKGYIEVSILNKEINELLFERDYSTINQIITDYRHKKGQRARSSKKSLKSNIKRTRRRAKKS